MAAEITSRTISVMLNRLKGIPRSAGSWQASAFICAISTGKKNKWSSCSFSILKSPFSVIEKTLAPLANCFPWQIKLFTYFLILHALRSQKDYLRPDYISIRCRIFSNERAQIIPFFAGQSNLKWTFLGHEIPPSIGVSYQNFNQMSINNT